MKKIFKNEIFIIILIAIILIFFLKPIGQDVNDSSNIGTSASNDIGIEIDTEVNSKDFENKYFGGNTSIEDTEDDSVLFEFKEIEVETNDIFNDISYDDIEVENETPDISNPPVDSIGGTIGGIEII